jgi:hypothetical protein
MSASISILRVSRQIHQEAQDLLYGMTKFDVPLDNVDEWVRRIGLSNTRALRSVNVQIRNEYQYDCPFSKLEFKEIQSLEITSPMRLIWQFPHCQVTFVDDYYPSENEPEVFSLFDSTRVTATLEALRVHKPELKRQWELGLLKDIHVARDGISGFMTFGSRHLGTITKQNFEIRAKTVDDEGEEWQDINIGEEKPVPLPRSAHGLFHLRNQSYIASSLSA